MSVKSGIVTVALCFLTCLAYGQDVTCLQLSVMPPVQLFPESYDVNGLRLNLLWAENENLQGIDLGLLNEVHGELGGISVGLVSGATETHGIQMALLFARTDEDFSGVQLAGLTAYSSLGKGFLEGLQVAGVSCIAEEVTGMQLALLCCKASDMTGIQISGLNLAPNVVGLQVGFVNWSQCLTGIQIGVLNICEDGGLPCLPFLNARF